MEIALLSITAVLCLTAVSVVILLSQAKERARWEGERSRLLDRLFEGNISTLHAEWRKDAEEPEPEKDTPIPRGVGLDSY